MSSTETRIPLDEARQIAEILGSAVLPSCFRVEIAGSIRRQRADIGDIDLVCQPILKPELDMFDEPTGQTRNLLTERLDWMVERGHLMKRLNKLGHPSWGNDLKRAVFRGLSVDIQSVEDRDTWGAWLVIRTGPADFNKALVTPRSKGGVLPSGFEFRDGFKLFRFGGQVPTPTELDLFRELGFEYQPPKDRGRRPLVPLAAPSGRAAEAGGG
jgi:DNA polymerase/3'-5' exonuclease PolX